MRRRRGLGFAFAVATASLATGPLARARDVEPPVVVTQVPGEWPKGEAERHDVVVPVVLTVAPDGTVTDARVEASVDPAFDEAAVAAAKQWRFRPATADGAPVGARVRAVVRFVGVSASAPSRAAAGASGAPAPTPVRAESESAAAKPPAQGAAVAPRAAAPAPDAGHADEARADSKSLDVEIIGRRERAHSASATEIPRAVIAAAPHRTANDALLVVPGVFVSQHGGEGDAYQIFYRGFDAVHGQDVEIWAGGAPVNDVSNIHGQGYADLNFVMPEVVRAIAAEPGTYDARQGDFAVAGTLRLDLGYDEPGLTAKATAGSFGTRRAFVAYHPASAGPETFAAVEGYSTDGYGPSRAARRASAIAQGTWKLGDDVRARVLATAYAARFDAPGVLRLDDLERGTVDRFGTYDPRQGGDATRASLVIEIADRSGATSIAPFVVLHSMRLRQDFTGYLLDPENGDATQQINRATTLGVAARHRIPLPIFSRSDAIEAGVYARTDGIEQSQRRIADDGSVTRDEVDAAVRTTDVAAWLDWSVRPFRRLRLDAGLRLDGLFDATDDSGGAAEGEARSAMGAHLGKKASGEVILWPGVSAVASYGEGFRSPQARSLADGETAPFTEIVSYEAGLRYRDEALSGSVAAFRTLLSDDLVFDQTTARNEPVPATARTGVAAQVMATPAPWFSSSVSATWTRAVFRASGGGFVEGALVPYAPELVARADVAVTPRLGTVLRRALEARVGLGSSLVHGRPLPYGETGRDVFLVDATARARLREVELGVDVFNLLDAYWYDGEFTYASSFVREAAPSLVPARHVTVGAPRTVLFTLALYLGGPA